AYRRARGVALAGAFATIGCGAGATARIVSGAENVTPEENAMQADGIVFAPFEVAITESGDGDSFRCIDAANKAASAALSSRYTVKTAEPYSTRRNDVAPWDKGPGGRVAVHIEAVRCGLVVANPTYAAAGTDDLGGPDESRGVVVLTVVDRTTGAV